MNNNENEKLITNLENIPEGKIRVVVKKVGQAPSIELIDNTLQAKQDIVDGLIEVVYLEDDILLICNEEGKLFNMDPNLIFDYDYIAGDCFFIGDDYKTGDFKSLSKEQITDVLNLINERSVKYTNLEDLEKDPDTTEGKEI